VMAETNSSPFTSTTTSAITPPSRTDLTLPLNWLRALSMAASHCLRVGGEPSKCLLLDDLDLLGVVDLDARLAVLERDRAADADRLALEVGRRVVDARLLELSRPAHRDHGRQVLGVGVVLGGVQVDLLALGQPVLARPHDHLERGHLADVL